MKQTGLFLLLILLSLPLAAQQPTQHKPADTTYIFRFVPEKDEFFVPFAGNQAELDRLCAVITEHIDLLRAGRMYICVSSFTAIANTHPNIHQLAYLRYSRVKSELILRTGVTEQMFLTDRGIIAPYRDSLRNVVVVSFPASVEKIEQLAGAKTAEVVRSYYREMEMLQNSGTDAQHAAAQQQQEADARQAEELRKAEETRKQAQAERERKSEAERQSLDTEERPRMQRQSNAKPYTLALRANLLRWATLTTDLGVEWRIAPNWSILVDGTWTSWSWNMKNRRYALWEGSPAIHYYIGKEKRGYVGAMYHIGQFNYKLSDMGKQGDLQGGGIVGGYRLPISKCLILDFNLGVGYTRADFDNYTVIDDVRVRRDSEVKNYWGINKAGVTLVWKLF